MQTLTPEEFKKRYGTSGVAAFGNTDEPKKTSRFAVPSLREVGSSIRDVATGAGKGLVESGTSLVQGLNAIGTGVQAAVDPTRTYGDLKQRQEEIRSPFSGSRATQINDSLKADNTGEKAGKTLGFLAELMSPTGARKAVTKGAEVTGDAFKGISSKISQIPDDLLEDGVKVKDKIIDLVSNLDDKTKSALNRTDKDTFNRVLEQGRQALLDDRNRTPLEAVGDDIISSLEQIKSRASSIGKQKAEYLNKAKIGLKRTGDITRNALLDTKRIFSGMKLDAGDKKAVASFFDELKKISKNPTLAELDRTIDLLQDGLYKSGRNSAVEVTDRVTGPLRKILGELNGKAQDIGGEAYKRFNSQYGDLMDVVVELNARVGKEGGSAGSFVKRLFSPSDARTKELFEQLEKLTGKDYFRDARLSKFIMESLGDTRAASLLEQIPTSPTDAIGKALLYGKKKLSDPIKAAEGYINKVRK